MPRQRASKLNMEHRTRIVTELLLKSIPSNRIVALLTQKEGISERSAWRYIKEAKAELEISVSGSVAEASPLMQAQVEYLLSKEMQKTELDHKTLSQMMKLKLQLINLRGKYHGQQAAAELGDAPLSPELEGALQRLKTSKLFRKA